MRTGNRIGEEAGGGAGPTGRGGWGLGSPEPRHHLAQGLDGGRTPAPSAEGGGGHSVQRSAPGPKGKRILPEPQAPAAAESALGPLDRFFAFPSCPPRGRSRS